MQSSASCGDTGAPCRGYLVWPAPIASLSNGNAGLQALELAAWEVADLKPLLSVLYALTCFVYYGSPAPHSSSLARVCWVAVNSTAPLLGLAVLMLLLLAASMLQLRHQSVLTVRITIPLCSRGYMCLQEARASKKGVGRGVLLSSAVFQPFQVPSRVSLAISPISRP